jgi:hypothetical protein
LSGCRVVGRLEGLRKGGGKAKRLERLWMIDVGR